MGKPRSGSEFPRGIAVIISVATLVTALANVPSVADAKPRHRHQIGRAAYFVDANGNGARMIGGRPTGCPHAYCGCGLAHYLGLHDRRLNLAWNWARLFPRTSPHSGAAAVRRGHVMLLQEHIAGPLWRVVDFNGGRHLSWLHERNVRGYVFVEPGVLATSMEVARKSSKTLARSEN